MEGDHNDNQKFLFSRADEISDSDLVQVGSGETYEEIRMSLKLFRLKALEEYHNKLKKESNVQD